MVRELCATIPPTSQGRHNGGHHETCSATHDSNSPDILSHDADVDDGDTDRQRHGLRRLPRGSAVRTARRSRCHPRASESGESARRRSDRYLRSAHGDRGRHPQSGESGGRSAFATSVPSRSEGQPSSVRLKPDTTSNIERVSALIRRVVRAASSRECASRVRTSSAAEP